MCGCYWVLPLLWSVGWFVLSSLRFRGGRRKSEGPNDEVVKQDNLDSLNRSLEEKSFWGAEELMDTLELADN